MEHTIEDLDLLNDLTTLRGFAWVLISVPGTDDDGGGFDVRIEVGPVLDERAVRTLLGKIVEKMDAGA